MLVNDASMPDDIKIECSPARQITKLFKDLISIQHRVFGGGGFLFREHVAVVATTAKAIK